MSPRPPRPVVDPSPARASGLDPRSTVPATRVVDDSGVIELRRGNRLDIFGDLDQGREFAPVDPSLDAQDQAAADVLSANAGLVAPSIVRPFESFAVPWEVIGPRDASRRVVSYELVDFGSYGNRMELTDQATLADVSLGRQTGTAFVSIWRSAQLSLRAVFRSGIHELARTDVGVDYTGCETKSIPLFVLSSLLRGTGTEEFLRVVRQEAIEADRLSGGDGNVTVDVVSSADAVFRSSALHFEMGLRVTNSDGSAIVRLAMEFMIHVRQASLAALIDHRRIQVEVSDVQASGVVKRLGAWLFGTPGTASIQASFAWGLQRFAEAFAAELERNLRPDSMRSPRPVAVAVEGDDVEGALLVRFCDTPLLDGARQPLPAGPRVQDP